MTKIEETIKKVLQSRMQPITDDSFTKSIVDTHLINKQRFKSKPFINFLPLIIGLSFLIISLGLLAGVKQHYDWIMGIGLIEEHGLILIVLSIVFLLYKWIDEFTASKTVYRSLPG
jgi:hypothetical protein